MVAWARTRVQRDQGIDGDDDDDHGQFPQANRTYSKADTASANCRRIVVAGRLQRGKVFLLPFLPPPMHDLHGGNETGRLEEKCTKACPTIKMIIAAIFVAFLERKSQ